MKLQIAALILGTMATLATAAQPPVGSASNNRNFAIQSGNTFRNVDLTDYDGKILLIMMMTPWCPFCQSNAQAVGDGILDHFNASSRGTLRGKNANGIEIHSILLSTEEAASWDAVNTSFSTTNGYGEWGLDANAQRNNPRQNLGYFRGDFIASSNLYAWGNDRRRVVVLNLVKNSVSHAYREIIINQNSFSSADNSTSRSAINAIQAAPVITAPAITTQPMSTTINSGGSVTLTVEASGTAPTFQWYLGESGDTSQPIPDATSPSYMTQVLTTSTNYWVRASNVGGDTDSTTATVRVRTRPAITRQPVSVAIASGRTARLRVFAVGTSPTFQWYKGAPGNTKSPVKGAIAATFTTHALKKTTTFWVRISNPAGRINSKAVTVTVKTVVRSAAAGPRL